MNLHVVSNRLLKPIGKPLWLPAVAMFDASVAFVADIHEDPDNELSISGHSQTFLEQVCYKVVEENLPPTCLQFHEVKSVKPLPPRVIDSELMREIGNPFITYRDLYEACKFRFMVMPGSRRFSTLTAFIGGKEPCRIDVTFMPSEPRAAFRKREINTAFPDDVNRGNEIIAPAQGLIV